MAIQPLLDCSIDETSLSTADQIALIESTTEYYSWTSSDSVIFLIGDNCEMNQMTATEMGVPCMPLTAAVATSLLSLLRM